MIKIEVNNGRKMEIRQDKATQSIKVLAGNGSNIDTNFNIAEGDFVMLLNYYRYIKENNIKCEFVNPNGKDEKTVFGDYFNQINGLIADKQQQGE